MYCPKFQCLHLSGVSTLYPIQRSQPDVIVSLIFTWLYPHIPTLNTRDKTSTDGAFTLVCLPSINLDITRSEKSQTQDTSSIKLGTCETVCSRIIAYLTLPYRLNRVHLLIHRHLVPTPILTTDGTAIRAVVYLDARRGSTVDLPIRERDGRDELYNGVWRVWYIGRWCGFGRCCSSASQDESDQKGV
jgi:hypothetical protein